MMSRSRTYISWRAMLSRCDNPKNKDFHSYGGKGISVCERWYSFANFLSDMGERPPKKSLDRLNNKLGYWKKNCRWATTARQALNRSATKLSLSNVRQIKRLARDGELQRVIGDQFGISQGHVSEIVNGKHWSPSARELRRQSRRALRGAA